MNPKLVAFMHIYSGTDFEPVNEHPLWRHMADKMSRLKREGVVQDAYLLSPEDPQLFAPLALVLGLRAVKCETTSARSPLREITDFVKKCDAPAYVALSPRSPFLSYESICKCIDAVMKQRHQSATTVQRIQGYLWTDGAPNYNLEDIPEIGKQAPVYLETGGCYVFRKWLASYFRQRLDETSCHFVEVGWPEYLTVQSENCLKTEAIELLRGV